MIADIISRYKNIAKDEKWVVKILIGGIISLVPILGWIVIAGYLLQLLKNVKDGDTGSKLPEWKGFEKLFMDGLAPFLFGLGMGIITVILTLIIQTVFCGFGPFIGFVFKILVGIISPAIMLIYYFRLIELKDWKLALNIGAIIAEFQNSAKEYLPTLGMFFVANILSFIAGCCFLSPFTIFYTAIVFYPKLAEIYLANNQGNEDSSTEAEEVKEETKVEKSEETEEAPAENTEIAEEDKESEEKKPDDAS